MHSLHDHLLIKALNFCLRAINVSTITCLMFTSREVDQRKSNSNVKPGHKVALEDIQEGACIIKYGMPIGVATCNIEKSEWVHTHNMRTGLDSRIEYRYNPEELIEEEKEFNCQSFLGYERKQGKVGVRNELWIIPTVGCVNSIVKMIEHEAKERLNQTESMDAIVAFTRPKSVWVGQGV